MGALNFLMQENQPHSDRWGTLQRSQLVRGSLARSLAAPIPKNLGLSSLELQFFRLALHSRPFLDVHTGVDPHRHQSGSRQLVCNSFKLIVNCDFEPVTKYLGSACRRHSSRPCRCSGRSQEDCHSERVDDTRATCLGIHSRLIHTFITSLKQQT